MPDAGERLPHIWIADRAEDKPYSRRPGGGGGGARVVDRRAHGSALVGQSHAALSAADAKRQAVEPVLRARGVFVTVEGSEAQHLLALERLERKAPTSSAIDRKWFLATAHPGDGEDPERAVVWVSDDARSEFLGLFERYLNEDTKGGKPKNQNLVANIGRVRDTVLLDLWQSEEDPPRSGVHWWEVWLRDTEDALAEMQEFAIARDLRLLERSLQVSGRIVVWIEARFPDMETLPFTKAPVTEIRRPSFVEAIDDLSDSEQAEYVTDLARRLEPAPEYAPAVCHLDTGVLREHLLLRDSLAPEDLHDVVGTSGTDVDGHGTRMAGLALHGPLDVPLLSSSRISLEHRLESVRILPGRGERAHDPLDYGSVTAAAALAPEIVANRRRVFCMPVSTSPDSPGEPTLWSATVDALSVGTDVVRDGGDLRLLSPPDDAVRRLFVIAAGNIAAAPVNHLDESDTSPIEDPAQAWNALTVAAYTDLQDVPSDPQFAGFAPVAAAGDLSPYSRTAVMFPSKWPNKPDICMEGGNALSDGTFASDHPLLSLLTTDVRSDQSLGRANATSAATAQAARLCALAMARYPDYWPETIRALVVHAADWTPAMRSAIVPQDGRTKAKLAMLRRYGWGVPTVENVISSTRQAATLVTQDEFKPFDSSYAMRTFRMHSLPWPKEPLDELGDEEVELRVTLSYYIEPSASRRGWRQKFSYQSHGLRFDLQAPTESRKDFLDRMNSAALDDETGRPGRGAGRDQWIIGSTNRHHGSLHQDIWVGTARELARSDALAVYPVGGWWKYQNLRDRLDVPVRYGLVVSLRTRRTDVDIYTPITQEIGVPVEAVIPI